MGSVVEWLQGKKTYGCLVLFLLTVFIQHLGWIPAETAQVLEATFLAGAGIAVRAAINKV